MKNCEKFERTYWYFPTAILVLMTIVIVVYFAFLPCDWSLDKIQGDRFEELRGAVRFVVGAGWGFFMGLISLIDILSKKNQGRLVVIFALVSGLVFAALPYLRIVISEGFVSFLMNDFRN